MTEECPLTEEEIETFVKSISSVMDVVEPLKNPIMSLKILSAVAAFIFCYKMQNEKQAHDLFDMFIDDIDEAVQSTKNHGITSWHEGTPH